MIDIFAEIEDVIECVSDLENEIAKLKEEIGRIKRNASEPFAHYSNVSETLVDNWIEKG